MEPDASSKRTVGVPAPAVPSRDPGPAERTGRRGLSLGRRIGLLVLASVLGSQLVVTIYAHGFKEAVSLEPEVAAVGILVAAVTAFFTARLVAGPVRELAATTRAIAAGNLNRRTGMQRADEIGELAADLDAMADALGQRESELRESERRVRALLEHGSDLIGIVDADGIFRYQSPSSRRVLGVAPEAIVGTRVLDWIHPDERPMFLDLLTRVRIEPWKPASTVARVPHADGSFRWIEVAMTAALNDPAINGIVLTGYDVTERIASDAELRRSAARMRALLAALPDSSFVLDPSGVLIEYHATPESRSFARPDALLGKHYTAVLPRSVAERLTTALTAIQATGRTQTIEYELRQHGGRVEYFDGRLAAVGTGGTLLAVRNITERKQAEAALRESELKFRRLAESTATAIVIYDGEHVFYVNPAAEQLTGYPADVLMTMPAYAIAKPEDRAELQASAYGRLVGEGAPSRREFQIVRRDGSVRWIDLAVGVTQIGGRPANVGTAYDITERKQAEEALQRLNRDLEARVEERTRQLAVANERLQAEVAERLNVEAALRERRAELEVANVELARAARLKDDFLASMSHELRTPLNAILGLAEAMQEEIYGPITARQRRSLRTIEDSGRDLLTLIGDILDLSKIGAEKLELLPEAVDVETACAASVGLVREAAIRKGHQLSVTIDPAVQVVRVDQRRLKQVLVNLLSNAVKFTPEGGRIGVDVFGDAARRQVCFVVWDTGIGIAPEDMSRLFKPFVQLDSRLARQHPGTGLGLSLVHRLVDLHGGSVAVESTAGEGTRFTVTLPWVSAQDGDAGIDVPPAGLQADVPVDANRHGPPLVLVADDNAPARTVIGDYLDRAGFRVAFAEDGKAAIERARSEPPAVILMDIQMPGIDGLEVIRRLRAIQEIAAVPIVALTALVMPGDRERCLAAGATTYLSKPVHLHELLQTVKELSREQPTAKRPA